MIRWYSYWLGLIPGKGWKLNWGTPFKRRKTWSWWGGGASPASMSNLTTLQHIYTTLTLTNCVGLHSQPMFDLNWPVRISAELSDRCMKPSVAVPTEAPEFNLKKERIPHYFRRSLILNDQPCKNIYRCGKSDAARVSCQRGWLVDKKPGHTGSTVSRRRGKIWHVLTTSC